MSKKKQGKEYKNNEKKDNYSIKRNKKPFSGKDLLKFSSIL
ncbi:MAG: hypothetical protein ACFE9C_18180 [Candidatus Hodarchaeota archaeon]